MSYTPTEWKSGDVVTSQKLNKMEAGIAAAGGVTLAHVNITQSDGSTIFTLDKTYAEIEAAIASGPVFIGMDDPLIGYYTWDNAYAKGYDEESGKYRVGVAQSDFALFADTEDDYPTLTLAPRPGPD